MVCSSRTKVAPRATNHVPTRPTIVNDAKTRVPRAHRLSVSPRIERPYPSFLSAFFSSSINIQCFSLTSNVFFICTAHGRVFYSPNKHCTLRSAMTCLYSFGRRLSPHPIPRPIERRRRRHNNDCRRRSTRRSVIGVYYHGINTRGKLYRFCALKGS